MKRLYHLCLRTLFWLRSPRRRPISRAAVTRRLCLASPEFRRRVFSVTRSGVSPKRCTLPVCGAQAVRGIRRVDLAFGRRLEKATNGSRHRDRAAAAAKRTTAEHPAHQRTVDNRPESGRGAAAPAPRRSYRLHALRLAVPNVVVNVVL